MQAAQKLSNHGVGSCYSPSSCDDLQLDVGCDVETIHSGWTENAFMLAPTASTLLVPLDSGSPAAAVQQPALDKFRSFV